MNSGSPLLLPNPGGHVSYLLRREARLRWHIAEMPVVCSHSILYRQVKREIGMVAGTIDVIHQWWAL